MALSLVLCGCAKGGAQAEKETGPQPETAETTEVNAHAQSTEENKSTGNDYYEAINQEILENMEIPADSNSWSYFYDLDNKAYKLLDTILNETVEERRSHEPESTQQKITDLYLSAIDMEARNELGFDMLSVYLDRIENAATVQEYAEAAASICRELGYASSLSFDVSADAKDSQKYAIYLQKPDLGPGKETFEDESQDDLLSRYKKYIETVLLAARDMKDKGNVRGAKATAEAENKKKDAAADSARDAAREAAASSKAILAFQKALAAESLPLGEANNPSQTYHVYTAAELDVLFSNLDMGRVMEAGGMGKISSFVVMEPKTEEKLNSYMTQENLPLLKAYSTFCLINDMAEYLPASIRDKKLVYVNQQKGIRENKADERLAGELVQNLLPFEFGKLYTDAAFSQEDKAAVGEMIDQIIQEYHKRIDNVNWMGEETKTAAKRKLETMIIKVGYPDKWPGDTARAKILPMEEGGSLVYNVLEIMKAKADYVWNRISQPVDRAEWGMTPQTVNAYYNPLGNEIVFPAAILQAPFYSHDASYAENLGGIGTVIAHEITHAFDDSGSLYDENGNYQVWWSEDDYKKFRERTLAVVNYYDRYEGFQGRFVNGAQTLGENIADLGALSCVTAMLGDDDHQLQLLFGRYARIWASKYTDESMILRLNVDVHSPAKVRVNAVLSSTDAFYLAYPEVKEGDGMYIAPEKRVKVW